MAARDPAFWQTIAPYLDQALELSATERPAWLADLRERIPNIAHEIEGLLADRDALSRQQFLEHPSPGLPRRGLAGKQVAAYTLIEPLGEGGMGSVWLAERSDGVFQQKVAVKLLRGGAHHATWHERFLKERTPELMEKNVRLQAIGRLTDLPAGCQRQLHESIERTAGNTGLTLILALSYGGRLEIIDGIKSLLRQIDSGHIDRAMIDVDMFSKHLYTRYYPDPDLLVRTSGEMRISNFLLWQLSYTEMYVTPKLWPDFGKEDLFAAVEEFGRRQRRYGAV